MRTGALVACVCAALVLGGAARTASGPALSFAAAKHYAVGTSPCSMAIGELSGDGKPDVVTANCHSTTVSVLLNRGEGAFETRRDYAAGERPERVEIADLNGDGKSDLLTANLDRTISVLFNQGAGTFGPPVTYALGLRPRDSLYDVLIADVNGDDKPDLVAEGGNDSIMVSVLLNHGDGTFEPKRDYLAGRPHVDIALGDVNADAKPDLVIAHDDCCVAVLLNGGEGSFETRREYEGVPFPGGVEIGDLNGDGKMDIATANYGDPLASVLLNRGDGSFGAPRSYGCGSCNVDAQIAPSAMAIADLNGDDKADLVTVWTGVRYGELHEGNEYVAGVSVRLNKGNGSFSPAHNYDIPGLPWLVIVDLNGDGKPDIAGGQEDGPSVLLNKGAGRFEPSLYYRFGEGAYAIASADLNGDGRQDFAALSGRRHAVAVRLNTPGLCNVQWVSGMIVASAKRRLGRANCRVGKITRVYRKSVARGRVISQKPRFGAVLRGGAKVDLVVSRGKRPAR